MNVWGVNVWAYGYVCGCVWMWKGVKNENWERGRGIVFVDVVVVCNVSCVVCSVCSV